MLDRPPLLLLAQERMDGELGERIRFLRRMGASWNVIANFIAEETGVRVTGESARRWARLLDQMDPDAETAAAS